MVKAFLLKANRRRTIVRSTNNWSTITTTTTMETNKSHKDNTSPAAAMFDLTAVDCGE